MLPQTLTDAVRTEFAATLPAEAEVVFEHERLVHTLGNLTLTGYNSELSNRPFSQKRTILAQSGVRMNQTIAERQTWGASEIVERGRALAERIIELWPGPNENLVGIRDRDSELRLELATVLAGIPSGRWTTYGEVAVMLGSHPVPVGSAIVNNPMPNPWRVLQAGGTVVAQSGWAEDGRTGDPRDLLRDEGIGFDQEGRADPEQFMDAVELAAGMGLDIDATPRSRGSTSRRTSMAARNSSTACTSRSPRSSRTSATPWSGGSSQTTRPAASSVSVPVTSGTRSRLTTWRNGSSRLPTTSSASSGTGRSSPRHRSTF